MDAAATVARYLDHLVAHDWPGLRSCLADDVVRTGPYGDVCSGADAYVAFLADLMPRLPGYSLETTRIVADGRVAVVELAETVAEPDGRPLRTPEAIVFDLDDQGHIRALTVYLGPGEHLAT